MQIASLWIILTSPSGERDDLTWDHITRWLFSRTFSSLEEIFIEFSNSPESFLCCFSSSLCWPLAELSSVFRFLATSDRGSRSSCCEPSPIFRRSSVFDWMRFCDSNKRNCCWCRRFLIRKIFGILEPVYSTCVQLCFSQFFVGFVTENSLENSARLRNSHFYSLFTIFPSHLSQFWVRSEFCSHFRIFRGKILWLSSPLLEL